MSDRKKPEEDAFERLIEEAASGQITWGKFEQELSNPPNLPASEKERIRTAAQRRRIETLLREPHANLEKELAAFPPLTDGARQFVEKLFREHLVEGAISDGLRARGIRAYPCDAVGDIATLYFTCDPRDGAEAAVARLVPILLHAVTGCFERAESSESLEARHYELISGFRGARVLTLISDSLHKDRPQRSQKK
jgi:hypothetical protein